MKTARRLANAFAIVAVVVACGCTDGTGTGRTRATTSTPASSSATRPMPPSVPGVSDRVVVRGKATVDGLLFDSRFVGAVVLTAGLVTPCQYDLPPVKHSNYQLTVLAATESSGCGAPGTQIVLWTFAHNKIIFSTDRIAWPGNGRAANLVTHYSSSAPAGAAPTAAQFTGGAFRADGEQLPPGTRIDAYVHGTRCGTASVRSSDNFTGYVLSVVGPDSIPGCVRGAMLTFRIDGRPAAQTKAVNIPPGLRDSLDLRLL